MPKYLPYMAVGAMRYFKRLFFKETAWRIQSSPLFISICDSISTSSDTSDNEERGVDESPKGWREDPERYIRKYFSTQIW